MSNSSDQEGGYPYFAAGDTDPSSGPYRAVWRAAVTADVVAQVVPSSPATGSEAHGGKQPEGREETW